MPTPRVPPPLARSLQSSNIGAEGAEAVGRMLAVNKAITAVECARRTARPPLPYMHNMYNM